MYESGHFPIDNSYDRFTVAFDLDGTLAHASTNSVIGGLDEQMARVVRRLAHAGVQCIIFTARTPPHARRIREWCVLHDLPIADVVCGAKPAADLYIDDRGPLPPTNVLEEWVYWRAGRAAVQRVGSGAEPSALLDEMRDTKENPGWSGNVTDARFRVVIPWSGGLDSTTLVGMAKHCGLFDAHAATTVYVDTGSPYSRMEVERLSLLADRLQVPRPGVLPSPVNYERHDHIDVGRNYVIIRAIVDAFFADAWGEIWFGNNASLGESPIVSGDKSSRFFNIVQHLLTAQGRDCRIVNPLMGMDKADVAAWWLRSERDASIPSMTFSCFAPVNGQECHACAACSRWRAALETAGFSVRGESEAEGAVRRRLLSEYTFDRYGTVGSSGRRSSMERTS